MGTVEIGDNLTGVLIALIAGIPAIIAAFYAWKANTTAASAVGKAVQTHDLVNSRMTELLELTRKSSRAEGVAIGAGIVSQPVVPTVAQVLGGDFVPNQASIGGDQPVPGMLAADVVPTIHQEPAVAGVDPAIAT